MYPLHLKRFFPRHLSGIANVIEWIYEIILYLIAIHIVILYVCTLYLNLHSGDLEQLVTCMFQTIIYMWTLLMKVYFRRIRPALLEDLMKSINSEYRTRSAIGITYVTMDECMTMSNKWFKTYFCLCSSGTILWLLQPIAFGDRSLPLPCWYPMDYKAPITYEIIYLIQSIAQLQVSATFCASSGFHMVLAILISGQYDVIFCSLKNILSTVAIRWHYLAKDELSQLSELEESSSPEVNQYHCSKEIEYSISSMTMLSTFHCNGNQKLQDFRQGFAIAFRMCILHHIFILGNLAKMEKFYSPIWFLKTGQVILLMCLVAFVSVKSTNANTSIIQKFSLAQYLLLVAFEFLMICYFGEIISYNSQRCGEAILRSPWYLYVREIKTDICLFLLISQRPFQLTAGRIYPLNIDCFKSVMTTAFTFLTFLQNLDERNLK